MIALVANGEITDLSFLRRELQRFSRIIAVDGGLRYLAELGITPEAITGDFDSASKELLEHYGSTQQIHLSDQNSSDLEKTLAWLNTTESVTVFGALGHRLDHTLSNLLLLARMPGRVIFETERERLYALSGEVTLELPVGTTLSLLPLGTVEGVSTRGLQWELSNATLSKDFYSISNMTTKPRVSLSIGSGDVILIHPNS